MGLGCDQTWLVFALTYDIGLTATGKWIHYSDNSDLSGDKTRKSHGSEVLWIWQRRAS